MNAFAGWHHLRLVRELDRGETEHPRSSSQAVAKIYKYLQSLATNTRANFAEFSRGARRLLPAWWSRGNSKSRSSLRSRYSGKARVAGDFQRDHSKKNCTEEFSPTRFIGTALPKISGFRTVSQEQKNQKRTGVSNLLCSTNEPMRNAGPVRVFEALNRTQRTRRHRTPNRAKGSEGLIDAIYGYRR